MQIDTALAGYDFAGRIKNDDYKQDADWQKQQSIWLHPPGETASQWLLNRLAAIRRMYEIEVRISC